jgi:sterol desaturase/sphingolipid hydroxylase (fatty acid hydroxylase superfamily)
MIGIPIGLATANILEWGIHKYVLHGMGKKRSSFWAFHWHEHHGASRRNDHVDPHYERSVFAWNAQGKEAGALVAGSLLVAPLFPVAPFFTATLWYSAARYYRVHRRAHTEPGWAREHLVWHYDHHMGPKADANWCVTHPWFDEVMGTRIPYAGTEREARDLERRQRRAAAASSASAVAPPQEAWASSAGA